MALLDGFRKSAITQPQREGLLPPIQQPQGLFGRLRSMRIDPRTAAGLQQAGQMLMAGSGWSTMPTTGAQMFAQGVGGYGSGVQDYDVAQAKLAADRINAQIEQRKAEAQIRKDNASAGKDEMSISGGGDPYTTAFGDSAEGRQLAVMAKQLAAARGVTPDQAIFAVAKWNQESAPSPIAVAPGGEVRMVSKPTLFGGDMPGAGSQPTPQTTPGAVGPVVASRPLEPKQLPQNLIDALQDNSSKLRMLKDIEAGMDNPDTASAVGPMNAIPGMASVGKYFRTPDQNTLLGLIAGLQSMTYKTISGANVTASEEPRLSQYVPNSTDNQDTIRNKVKRFTSEFEAIQNEIQAIADQQGYKGVDLPQQPPPSAASPTPSALDRARNARGGK